MNPFGDLTKALSELGANLSHILSNFRKRVSNYRWAEGAYDSTDKDDLAFDGKTLDTKHHHADYQQRWERIDEILSLYPELEVRKQKNEEDPK